MLVELRMISSGQLRSRAIRANAKFAVVLALLVIVPAASLSYWPGWILWANFSGWCFGLTLYLLKRDPALVERRMRAGAKAETLPSQKRIQIFNSLFVSALFVLSAYDAGTGRPAMPLAGILLGNVLVALGFLIIARVFKENSFAAATVDVAQDQRVVSTGPYAIVRHPMYVGAIVLFTGIPLALGSYWGLLLVLPLVAGIVARLLDEERHLRANLAGYEEYCRRVRYRLVPAFW